MNKKTRQAIFTNLFVIVIAVAAALLIYVCVVGLIPSLYTEKIEYTMPDYGRAVPFVEQYETINDYLYEQHVYTYYTYPFLDTMFEGVDKSELLWLEPDYFISCKQGVDLDTLVYDPPEMHYFVELEGIYNPNAVYKTTLIYSSDRGYYIVAYVWFFKIPNYYIIDQDGIRNSPIENAEVSIIHNSTVSIPLEWDVSGKSTLPIVIISDPDYVVMVVWN